MTTTANYLMTDLTNDLIRTNAPSVFATEKASTRSQRYVYIPTFDVIEGMRQQGFVVTRAFEKKARKEENKGYTKHAVVFRHPDWPLRELDQLIPEVLLTNSHDGTSGWQLHAALFRMICSNGMVVADRTYAKKSVRHSGRNAIDNVIDATFEVIESTPQVMQVVDQWKDIAPSREAKLILADSVLTARYGREDETDADGNPVRPAIQPAQLLQPRRMADRGDDLWTTMNVIQERMIKGGVQYRGENRLNSTREIKSVDENTRMNKAIWDLTARMADILAK